MKLDVPYISQLPLEDPNTSEKKWCGLACLAMVMKFYLKDAAPEAGDIVDKYSEDYEKNGYMHTDLLTISRENGLRGFRKHWWTTQIEASAVAKFKEEGETEEDIQDWLDMNFNESLYSIKSSLNQGQPVIISVSKEFCPSESSHLVVVIGYDQDQMLVHDPYTKGEAYSLATEDFKRYFLRQAIFIKP